MAAGFVPNVSDAKAAAHIITTVIERLKKELPSVEAV
jgi:hypothetical protein